MQFIPYLNFNGNCAEAFAFYAKLFGGTIVHQSTFGETPGMEQMPDSAKGLIMHAHLQIRDQALMASDATDSCGGGGYQQAQGMWISIGVDDATEGGRIFNALAEGGQVTMPFQPTFWSPGFGMVTDRFNTPWMVNVRGEA